MQKEYDCSSVCGAWENGKLLKAFEDFLLERTRKISALKTKEKCPGEDVCTTDRMLGHCASLGRTLEQECRPDRCTLFYTKKGSTPSEFQGLLEALAVCRARQKAGLDLINYPLPYWAEKVYLLGNGVYSQVQAELDEGQGEDGGEGEFISFDPNAKGDSDAFKLIREDFDEIKNRR